MDDFIKILTHARRLKSAVKTVSIEQLEEVRNKLDTIIEGRIAEQEEYERANAEHIEKVKKFRELLAADGIDPSELQDGGSRAVKKKKNSRPPKYAIEVAGKKTTWTGQGRMPNVFRARVDAGESIDKYLIKK